MQYQTQNSSEIENQNFIVLGEFDGAEVVMMVERMRLRRRVSEEGEFVLRTFTCHPQW